MRDIITIDFKNKDYFDRITDDIIDVFGDYDFPCWSRDVDKKRFVITDVKTAFDIENKYLHIEIIVSAKHSIFIPIKLKEIDLFQYDRIPGIKGKEK